MHHILFYDYVPDVLERRGPYREAHLARIAEWRERGEIVLGGALGDPVHGAAIVFADGVERAAIEAFADEDPYLAAGLVRARRIEPWAAV